MIPETNKNLKKDKRIVNKYKKTDGLSAIYKPSNKQ